MFSNSNTYYTETEKRAVWNKGITTLENDPNIWRKDKYGDFINWSDYGNRDSKYGWEIDHIYPESRGGSNSLSNLQPLHWKNNVKKSDKIA